MGLGASWAVVTDWAGAGRFLLAPSSCGNSKGNFIAAVLASEHPIPRVFSSLSVKSPPYFGHFLYFKWDNRASALPQN